MTRSTSRYISLWRLLGLGLFSGSLLFVEISLTRLFSTLYYPPVVFMILSLSVLGIGFGAGLAAWLNRWREVQNTGLYMSMAALAILLLVSIVFFLLPAVHHIFLFVIAPVPFLFSGLTLSTLFSAEYANSPKLYMADMLGAGCGAILLVPVLHLIGIPSGLVAAVVVVALAALVFTPKRMVWLPISTGIVGIVVLTGNQMSGWLQLDMRQIPVDKPIAIQLDAGARTLQTSWDAFARTDLIDPGSGQPYELYTDGAAGSIMPPADGHDALWRDIGFFPFATEQPERVFVIGPGGGLDVWFGLQANTKAVTAVEVNAANVDLVHEYHLYNGDLYGNSSVRVVVDEGRSVLERENTLYDLIFLSQVVTLAAERDGYTLIENTAYTIEAFETYLEHLRPEGQIALKLYDEPTLTRALVTAVAAFNRQGLSDLEALQHMIVLLDANVDTPIPLLMVRETPYSENDSLSIGSIARDVGFQPLFLPSVWAEAPLDSVLDGSLSLDDIISEADGNFAPTVDDRPFYFQFERGVPDALHPLLLAIAIAVGATLILVLVGQRGPRSGRRYAFAGYFALLGAGFMITEVTVIQQTRLFLGHPIYSVTLVLAVLLVGGGIGSGLAGKLVNNRRSSSQVPWAPILGIIFTLGIWLFFWPMLSANFHSQALYYRLAITVLALLPMSLLIGTPFPLGLRTAGEDGSGLVAVGWAVNGVMSVAGSVTAVTLAMLTGYNAVLVTAILIYCVSLLVAIRINRLE